MMTKERSLTVQPACQFLMTVKVYTYKLTKRKNYNDGSDVKAEDYVKLV